MNQEIELKIEAAAVDSRLCQPSNKGQPLWTYEMAN